MSNYRQADTGGTGGGACVGGASAGASAGAAIPGIFQRCGEEEVTGECRRGGRDISMLG